MKTKKFMLNSDGLVIMTISGTSETTIEQVVTIEGVNQEIERNEMIIKTLENRNLELKADKKEIEKLLKGK